MYRPDFFQVALILTESQDFGKRSRTQGTRGNIPLFASPMPLEVNV